MKVVLRQLSLSLPAKVQRTSFFDEGVIQTEDDADCEASLAVPEVGPAPVFPRSPSPAADCSQRPQLASLERTLPLPLERPLLPPLELVAHEGEERRAADKAEAAAEEAFQRRHAELVRKGLRYVVSAVAGLLDTGRDAPTRLRQGLPVRLLTTAGSHSKVSCEGYHEGVWVPSAALSTDAPRRPVPPARARPAPLCAPAGARPRVREEAAETRIDEAQLPDDAPPGHPAHERARYNGTHANPLVSFRFEGVPFQTTVAAAGSRRAAEVIARACWMRFERGETKENVLRFRNECYVRVNPSGSSPAAKRIKVEHHVGDDAGLALEAPQPASD